MPVSRREAKTEATVTRSLEASLELFSSQGFRATSMRQIAQRSGVSVGNLYHHFAGKEAIFERLLEGYWERLLDPDLPLNRRFARAEFPEDLEEIAAEIERVVEENASYILLIYVDVIEFRGRHIRAFYERMTDRFERVYGRRFEERRRAGEFGEVDPLLSVMVAVRWLFYFFTVEKCFGVPMHFGMEPQRAVDGFIRLLRYGLLRRDASRAAASRRRVPRGGEAGAKPRRKA